MITVLLHKIQKALRNDNCRYCQDTLVREGLVCMACKAALGFRVPQPYVRRGRYTLYAATTFNPRMKRLLYAHKFYHRQDCAETLSDILIEYWNTLEASKRLSDFPASNTLVVPVPSRWHASHVTPFARRFASEFGYGFNESLLLWTRDTEPQHTITGMRRRLENVRDSLAVDEAAWNRCVKALSMDRPQILILDDLATTGATLSEALKAFFRCPGFSGNAEALAICHMPLALHRQ